MKTRPSILIVDDDTTLLAVLREACVHEGFPCSVQSRAEDALKIIAQGGFEVLLTDIVMPGIKGLDLARRAKEIRPETIVLIMTGFIGDFSYDEAISAGASDFIKKPFTIQELAMRIRHAQLQEHLREQSITDELTGLPNRRGFFAFAEQQLRVVRRNKGRMVLLFADLDDFKQINDTRGHQAGDQALIDAADIFRETFRDSDIIARMSGDEFAVVLLDAPEAGVAAAGERLARQLEEYNAGRDGFCRLSVSFGIAVCDHERSCSLDDLLREADTRMYEQKQRKKGLAPPDRRG